MLSSMVLPPRKAKLLEILAGCLIVIALPMATRTADASDASTSSAKIAASTNGDLLIQSDPGKAVLVNDVDVVADIATCAQEIEAANLAHSTETDALTNRLDDVESQLTDVRADANATESMLLYRIADLGDTMKEMYNALQGQVDKLAVKQDNDHLTLLASLANVSESHADLKDRVEKAMAGPSGTTFTSDGTFTAESGGIAEILLVAGGGGAGGCNSGGGGAGGVLHVTVELSKGDYAVTIGAGGQGNTGRSMGYDGANSIFKGGSIDLVAVGGGAGSDSYAHFAGNDGGSGGGAFDPPGAGGKGVSGQGHNGGVGILGDSPRGDDSSYRMGGGGGAGEVGNKDGHGMGGDGRYFSQFKDFGGSPAGWFGGGGNAGCHGDVAIPRTDGGGGVGGTCEQSDRNAVDSTGGGGGGAICGTCDGGGVGGSGIAIVLFKPKL